MDPLDLCGVATSVALLSANVVPPSMRAPFGKTFTDLLNEGRHPNRWPNALVNAWLTSSLQ